MAQVLLRQNEKAPYEGVLVPEGTYRKMAIDAFSKTDFEKYLYECQKECDGEYTKDTTMWFAAGVTLGSFLVIALKK
jgi:hypothetical protein